MKCQVCDKEIETFEIPIFYLNRTIKIQLCEKCANEFSKIEVEDLVQKMEGKNNGRK